MSVRCSFVLALTGGQRQRSFAAAHIAKVGGCPAGLPGLTTNGRGPRGNLPAPTRSFLVLTPRLLFRGDASVRLFRHDLTTRQVTWGSSPSRIFFLLNPFLFRVAFVFRKAGREASCRVSHTHTHTHTHTQRNPDNAVCFCTTRRELCRVSVDTRLAQETLALVPIRE